MAADREKPTHWLGNLDDNAWDEAKEKGKMSAYDVYLRRFPRGRHESEAREGVAYALRERVLRDPTNRGVLAVLQVPLPHVPELQAADRRHALGGLVVSYLIVGAVGGVVLGAAFGGAYGSGAALFWGIMGGLLAVAVRK